MLFYDPIKRKKYNFSIDDPLPSARARFLCIHHHLLFTLSVSFLSTHSEDKGSFNTIVDAVKTNYNDRFDEIRKRWGGGIMGFKTNAARAKVEKLKAKEMAQKM